MLQLLSASKKIFYALNICIHIWPVTYKDVYCNGDDMESGKIGSPVFP